MKASLLRIVNHLLLSGDCNFSEMFFLDIIIVLSKTFIRYTIYTSKHIFSD